MTMSRQDQTNNIMRWLNHPEERNQIPLLASYIACLRKKPGTQQWFSKIQVDMLWEGGVKKLFFQEKINIRWKWFLKMLYQGSSFKTPVVDAWKGGLQDKFLSLNNKDLKDILPKIFKSRIREIGSDVIEQPKVKEYMALLKSENNLVSVYDLLLHSLSGQSPAVVSFAEKIFFSFDLNNMLTKIQYDKLQKKLTGSAPNRAMREAIMRKLERSYSPFKEVSRKPPLEDKGSFKEDLTQPATMSSLQIEDDGLPTAIPVPPPSSVPMLARSGFSLFSQTPPISSLPIGNDDQPIALTAPPPSLELMHATSGFSFFSYNNEKDLDMNLISQSEDEEKLSYNRSMLNDFRSSQPLSPLPSLDDWMASLDKDEQDTSSPPIKFQRIS